MNSHFKWTDFRPSRMDWEEIKAAAPHQVEMTKFWVRGYILALEDTLQDLQQMSKDAPKVPYDTHTLLFAKARIRDTLDSAQKTLDTLNEIMEEGDGEAVQAPAHQAQAP